MGENEQGCILSTGASVQRRLFFLFLLFSTIPALVILAVNWQISQRNLDVLDSPGLQRSVESSLLLARSILSQELAATGDEAQALADAISVEKNIWPEPGNGCGYLFVSQTGSQKIAGKFPARFFDDIQSSFKDHQQNPVRLKISDGDWLVASAEIASGSLLYVRPLEQNLAQQLDAVAQGGSRFRQLRLYYSDLLRTDTIVTLIIFALAVLLVSLIMSRQLARQIARPVTALARGTEQVAEGNLDLQIDVHAPNELGDLVSAFNRMTGDLKRNKEDLIQAERIAAWQGIARRLAHEIKNPLTPIALAMHRIQKRTDDATVRDSINAVLKEVDNLKLLADEFSLYARVPEPIYETVDLQELIRSVVALYVDSAKVTVNFPVENHTLWQVRVDPGQIRQVAANLIKNALHAMQAKGTLSIRFIREGDRIILSFIDSGPGLPEPTEQVFAPNFTTRSTGTGLGLAIARKIVEDHGGHLDAGNVVDGGAEFRMNLPSIDRKQT
jgi:nitrogen fixation/metabolism regulation signal transduction histidine kinase